MEETFIVCVKCPHCGKVSEVEVPLLGYLGYEDGELIQDALPDLPTGEREVLISGMCIDCQKKIFGKENN